MNQPTNLTLFQRGIAFCLAAVVTLGLLGGIDQLAHQPQVADAWAGTTASAPRA